MNWINGKKTYLGLIAMGVLAICYEMGVPGLTDSVVLVLNEFLEKFTGVAIVHKVAKLTNAVVANGKATKTKK